MTSVEPVSFMWAFQKEDIANADDLGKDPTYKYKNDRAIIYNVNVTNTIHGGATSCKSCPAGATHEG